MARVHIGAIWLIHAREVDLGLTGEELKENVINCSHDVKMLVDGLIAQGSITQFYADDGVGKSVILLNGMMEASSGSPLFGALECARPLKCMFFMGERHQSEVLQRMKIMCEKIQVNWDNFYLEPHLQGYDFLDSKQKDKFINEVITRANDFGQVDWIHLDPIYAWVSSELVGEPGANAVNSTLNRLQGELGCAISYNHHSNRGFRTEKGRTKGDSYGSRFLSACLTGKFNICLREDKLGTVLEREKDSWSCLNEKIELTFDSQFFTNHIGDGSVGIPKKDRILYFLRRHLKEEKTFDFKQFCDENDVSTGYARIQLRVHIENGNLICCNPNDKKHLYKVLRVV